MSDPITQDYLDGLKRLYEAACDPHKETCRYLTSDSMAVCNCGKHQANDEYRQNARTALPLLVSEVERQRGEIERLRVDADRWAATFDVMESPNFTSHEWRVRFPWGDKSFEECIDEVRRLKAEADAESDARAALDSTTTKGEE